ncbi:MAG: O-antigen ligase family protein [Rhodospirillales bacterium]|nr:O-antigen ligase family protein [Rhodospirillales bacterium]
MLRGLACGLLYLAFLVLGSTAPFAFTLGYVWVDAFVPQDIGSMVLGAVPVAMVMGTAAILFYVLADRRAPPRLRWSTILTVMMAAWCCVTLLWAVAPHFAVMDKWSWAFKTVLFSAFIPYVIRSRVQIEAFILVFVFASLIQILPVGVKQVVSGGAYGMDHGLILSNSGLSESSTLATVCLMLLPWGLWLSRHALMVPMPRLRRVGGIGLAVMYLITSVGTFARTGLIGMAVLGMLVFMESRRKLITIAAIIPVVAGLVYFAPPSWTARMDTIAHFQKDPSAMTRIEVWKWTLRFASTHPLGGGFNSFYINTITVPSLAPGDPPVIEHGRAFHNSFMEVLGEQGFPGIAMFLALVGGTWFSLKRTARRCRGNPDLLWCEDLAKALGVGLLVLVPCSMFIGIAFQPFYWYNFALGACLSEYARRATAKTAPAPAPGRLAVLDPSLSPAR